MPDCLEEQVRLLKELHNASYTHVVTTEEVEYLNVFEILVTYPPKVSYTFEDLLKEFNSLWPVPILAKIC